MSVPARTTNQLSKCHRDRVDVSTCKDHKPVVQVLQGQGRCQYMQGPQTSCPSVIGTWQMSVPVRTTNQLSKCYRDRVDVSTCKAHKPVVQVLQGQGRCQYLQGPEVCCPSVIGTGQMSVPARTTNQLSKCYRDRVDVSICKDHQPVVQVLQGQGRCQYMQGPQTSCPSVIGTGQMSVHVRPTNQLSKCYRDRVDVSTCKDQKSVVQVLYGQSRCQYLQGPQTSCPSAIGIGQMSVYARTTNQLSKCYRDRVDVSTSKDQKSVFQVLQRQGRCQYMQGPPSCCPSVIGIGQMSVPIRTTNQLSKCYRDRVDVSTCKDHKPVVQVIQGQGRCQYLQGPQTSCPSVIGTGQMSVPARTRSLLSKFHRDMVDVSICKDNKPVVQVLQGQGRCQYL